eukprot:PhF_6_TR37154/c0_g1_i2/m.54693
MEYFSTASAVVNPSEYITNVISIGNVLVASTTHTPVRLATYDAATMLHVFTFPMHTPSKITGVVQCTDTQVVSCFEDGTVTLYDVRASTCVANIKFCKEKDTQAIAAACDGSGVIAVGDGANIHVADLRNRKVLTKLENHSDSVNVLTWAPDA